MARIESAEERSRAYVRDRLRAIGQDVARTKRRAAPAPAAPLAWRPRRRFQPHHHLRALRQSYGLVLLVVFMAFAAWPQVAPALGALPGMSALLGAGGADVRLVATSGARAFPLCGAGRRVTCVVDGDTFWMDGEKIRIADIDTPEISRPQCAAEKARGDRATLRLQSLLNAGAFEMRGTASDKYGRALRTLHRDGASLGDRLVDEGLAHRWIGHKQSWCG